ncbi:MAG TPA: DUF1800 domain-containing protein [Candidatus Sulfotelmatobacter sp.]|nr:DUF1800 domain-containing protein [Candidatus Sulfotelmatobacter sp.]
MRSSFVRFTFGKLALCLSLIVLISASAAPDLLAKKKDKDKAAESGANDQKRAMQALNRLTFGPRPGDIEQVMAMGVDRWIDLQLHPEKIPDSAVESRLAAFRTLRMSSKEIVEEFPDNQMVKQVMEGKKPMPSDPARRAVYQVQIARMQEKQEKKEQKQEAAAAPAPVPAGPAASDSAKTEAEPAAASAASADASAADGNSMASTSMSSTSASPSSKNATASSNTAPANEMSMAPPADPKPAPVDDAEARRREDRLYADLKIQALIDLAPAERYKKVMAMSADEKVAFADSLRGGKGQDFLAGLDPKQKETLMAMNNPQAVVQDELVQAKLLRAIYSERQLEEVMTDFWFNHFNVFVGKGPEKIFLTNYEQDVIRPHALGKFEDLLVATAKSPAMLFYLDNWMSEGPNSLKALGIPEHPSRYIPHYPPGSPYVKRKQNNGLNENYGRELLELHTLSVNGGYSQRDVTEVAKVFTGWTIEKPYEGLGFKYDPRMHEPGPKFVLGHRIKPKGEAEGREVLHMLATSPQTAHFISLKLAQRFVADDPPPELVDRMAKTFQKKKGDIREVLSTLFHSPEFWADGAYRAKVKTPLEFVASTVRATGANVDDAMPLARQIGNMGMPLYAAQPPTGYSMKAETWVSSSALLNRMNFALGLTGGKVRGVKMDAVQLAGGPPAPADATVALSALEAKLLAGDVSKQTHDSIMAQINMAQINTAQIEAPAKNALVPSVPAQPDKDSQQKRRKPADVPRPPDASTMAGLLLGSPEFQKR